MKIGTVLKHKKKIKTVLNLEKTVEPRIGEAYGVSGMLEVLFLNEDIFLINREDKIFSVCIFFMLYFTLKIFLNVKFPSNELKCIFQDFNFASVFWVLQNKLYPRFIEYLFKDLNRANPCG